MAEFDPSTANVDDVLKKLDKADEQERQRILKAERSGKNRKSVLEPYGVDPDQRADAEGRALYPWEVSPDEAVQRVVVEETEEERKAREAQAAYDEKVAAARPQVDEQGGGSPLGAADTGTAGAAAVPTSGNTSMGAPTT